MLVEIRHVEYNVSPPTKYRAGPGTSQQLTLASAQTKLFLTGQISQNARLPAGSSAKSEMAGMLPDWLDA